MTSVWRAWSGSRPTWRIPSSRYDQYDDDDVDDDDFDDGDNVDYDDFDDGDDGDHNDVPLLGRSYTLLRTGLVH